MNTNNTFHSQYNLYSHEITIHDYIIKLSMKLNFKMNGKILGYNFSRFYILHSIQNIFVVSPTSLSLYARSHDACSSSSRCEQKKELCITTERVWHGSMFSRYPFYNTTTPAHNTLHLPIHNNIYTYPKVDVNCFICPL